MFVRQGDMSEWSLDVSRCNMCVSRCCMCVGRMKRVVNGRSRKSRGIGVVVALIFFYHNAFGFSFGLPWSVLKGAFDGVVSV